jgi:hypothetical protein
VLRERSLDGLAVHLEIARRQVTSGGHRPAAYRMRRASPADACFS